jgi:hypothetical protein
MNFLHDDDLLCLLMVYMHEGSKIVLFKKSLTIAQQRLRSGKIWQGPFYPLMILLSCIFFEVGMTML